MKRIVVLTDFSQSSAKAVNSALNYAAKQDAELLIWYLMNESSKIIYELDRGNDFRIINDNTDTAFDLLDAWRSQIVTKEVKAEIIISVGSVENLLDQISHYEPSLLLLGRRGGDDTTESIGSFAKEIVEEANMPICIIDEELIDFDFEKIVFASKFDSDEQEAFEGMIRLLEPTQHSKLHLLSIDTVGYFAQPSAAVKESMKKFASIAGPLKVESFLYKDYSVQAGIRHYINESYADLLVMNGNGNHPVKRFFQKSAAVESALNSNIPVLIMH